MKFLLHLLKLTGLSALAGAVWVAHRPADLSAVTLRPPASATPKAREREVVDELKQAAIKSAALVEFSEADVNQHLAKVLVGTPPASLKTWLRFNRLVADLEPDLVRLTLEWQVASHRCTAAVDVRVTRQAKTFRVEIVGGRYGHLTVPRGLLRPLKPALEELAQALQPEIQALFQMNQIRFAKDKLVLDPRFL